MIPLSVPEINSTSWKYVRDCLDTGWVSSVGKYVDRFEQKICDYTNARYAVACINGTSALHTALLIAGIEPGDEVIVPALTFVAPANAVLYCGACPVFIDVDINYWQLDIDKIKDFLTNTCSYRRGEVINKKTGRPVKAIVAVHLLGHPCDMDEVIKLAKQFNLIVIEDAAESIGAEYKGRKVGTIGDIGCFSFNGNKIITCGGGGMIVTGKKEWAEKAKYLTTQAKDDPLEYIHNDIGYNYRLTNVQAAIGVSQMEVLDQYILKKKKIAKRYHNAFKNVEGIVLPQEAPWAYSIFWLYTILVNKKIYGEGSRQIMHRLGKGNIQTRPLWHPIYRLKPFKKCYAHQISVADHLYQQGLSLPSSPGLSAPDQQKVITSLCLAKKFST